MGYRQVIINKSEKLKTKDNNLVVVKENKEVKVPLEDISFILLEDNKTLITAKLLSELGKYAICFITCDDNFEPSTITYPYNYHFKQLDVMNKQLNQTKENKDKIWQIIVKQKIINQIKILEHFTDDQKTIDIMYKYTKEIKLLDETNREGLAAKLYFKSLYGSAFIRFYDDAINASLNYGYTIIKSAIIRQLAVHGLNTYLGVKHISKVNNFNLAYDLIEPYRAVVDKFVYENIDNLVYPLSFDIKKRLVALLNEEVICDNKKYTLDYSIELFVLSYIKSLDSENVALVMPTIFYV